VSGFSTANTCDLKPGPPAAENHQLLKTCCQKKAVKILVIPYLMIF